MPSFEAMRQGYLNLWGKMTVERSQEALGAAEGIIQDKARYQNVEKATGVPWFFIGPVHHRESNRSFAGVLHNGERIIGTGRKTSLVPAGRGPFDSWDGAAIDAMEFMRLDKVPQWDLARTLYEFERYNGFGYIKHKVNSPYVWAGTNMQQPGKYVSDGNFDAGHIDTQLGCAAMLSKLMELDESIAQQLGSPGQDATDDSEPGRFLTLKDYGTAALATELASRHEVEWVDVRYRKPTA